MPVSRSINTTRPSPRKPRTYPRTVPGPFRMTLNEFRDPAAADALMQTIRRLADGLTRSASWRCAARIPWKSDGSARSLLPANVQLISGPGCPVCRHPGFLYRRSRGPRAREARPDRHFRRSLPRAGQRFIVARAKAQGALIDVVASPRAALDIAKEHPADKTVFTAVGFETTIPAVASVLRAARDASIISPFLSPIGSCRPRSMPCGRPVAAHYRIPTARPRERHHRHRRLWVACAPSYPGRGHRLRGARHSRRHCQASRPDRRHSGPWKMPIRASFRRGKTARARLHGRGVRPCHVMWRGIGSIPLSGCALRPAYSAFDAARRFGLVEDDAECRRGAPAAMCWWAGSGPDVPLFGTACTPDHPVGPCMVSSEGSCAAAFR